MRNLLFILLCCYSNIINAAHIVGGDFYYKCLGNNRFEITFKLYRDCGSFDPNAADFDAPAIIAIYEENNTLPFQTIDQFVQTITDIPPLPSNPCFQAPANVCVEEGLYQFEITLPANTGNYHVVYQRCCRNGTIVNIINPAGSGATYFGVINTNAPNNCNNSPVFTNFPPIVICANEPLVFDHSATDADGDRLEYSFYTPFNSLNTNGDGLDNNVPYGTPSSPPYAPVNWSGGYGVNAQVTSNPSLTINPLTGLITGTPNQAGQYVVGVLVKEFRNNVLIGETRRDFQFNVTQCLSGVTATIPTLNVNDPIAVGTDGIFVYECNDFTVQFENQSILGTNYFWDFGNLNATNDTSNLFEPSYTFPDTGVYRVKLVVNPGLSCSDSTTVIVKIYPQFATNFSFVEQCEPFSIPFTDLTTSSFNDVNSWAWNFGDGNSTTQQNPQHTYQNAGQYNVRLISTSSKGCIDTLAKTVILHAKPNAQYTTTPTCLNTPIKFYDTTVMPFESVSIWEWRIANATISSDSSFTATYNSTQTFNLQLIVTTDFGCKDTIIKPITIFPLPSITFPTDFETCFNDTIQFNATGGVKYDWYSSIGDTIINEQNPIYVTSNTTNFSVLITDTNQCSGIGQFLVTVFPLPNIDAGNDDYVCLGSQYNLNGIGDVTFSWSPGNVLNDSTIANPIANIIDTTTFIFTTTSQQGCINKDTIIIDVQKPIIATLSSDTFICEKDTLQLLATGGIFYEWTPSLGLNNAAIANPLASPITTTNYSVKIANNCFDTTLSVNIIVYPLPIAYAGIDDTIYRADSLLLIANGGIEYSWSPGNSLSDSTASNTYAKPFNTTSYIVTVTDVNSCKNTDTVIVFIDATTLLLLPTAFSPNQDGVNDRFRILRGLNILKLLEFKVFNRWGQLVFETNNMNAGWDGFFKGETAEIGVYQFFAKAITYDGNIIIEKGNVTLLR